jgi:nuclease S1
MLRRKLQIRICRIDVPTSIGQIDPSSTQDDNQTSIGKHQPRVPKQKMPSRVLRRSWFAFSVTLLAALQPATPAWAWAPLGHRVISRLAEKHMTPAAKAAVAALLEPGESLADASTWADEHRRELPKTAPWHYVDVPLDEPKYDAKFSGDDRKKGCVVDKINEFRLVIKDKSKTIEERRFALRFLIHCVEHMHMPMHVGDNKDKVGNKTQVRFFDKGTNMHRLWDSDMIQRTGNTEKFWLADLGQLDTPEARSAAMKGTVEDWATESLLAARQAYQDPVTGKRIKPGPSWVMPTTTPTCRSRASGWLKRR